MRSWCKLLPTKLERQTGEYKESPPWEPVSGRENCTVIVKLLEARCEQDWEIKTPGGPTHREAPIFLWILPPGVQPRANREKSPCASGRGRAKGTIFQNALRHFILLSTSWPAIKKKIQGIIKSKIQQSIRFFLTKSVLRRNYLELNLLGYNQGLTDLGERKYLTPVPPSNPLT